MKIKLLKSINGMGIMSSFKKGDVVEVISRPHVFCTGHIVNGYCSFANCQISNCQGYVKGTHHCVQALLQNGYCEIVDNDDMKYFCIKREKE